MLAKLKQQKRKSKLKKKEKAAAEISPEFEKKKKGKYNNGCGTKSDEDIIYDTKAIAVMKKKQNRIDLWKGSQDKATGIHTTFRGLQFDKNYYLDEKIGGGEVSSSLSFGGGIIYKAHRKIVSHYDRITHHDKITHHDRRTHHYITLVAKKQKRNRIRNRKNPTTTTKVNIHNDSSSDSGSDDDNDKEKMYALHEEHVLRALQEVPNILQLVDFYIQKEHFYTIYELPAFQSKKCENNRCRSTNNKNSNNVNNEKGTAKVALVVRPRQLVVQSLFDYLLTNKSKAYTEYDAREVIQMMLVAVQSLHKHNIVHRNLQPNNLLIEQEQEQKEPEEVSWSRSTGPPTNGRSNNNRAHSPPIPADGKEGSPPTVRSSSTKTTPTRTFYRRILLCDFGYANILPSSPSSSLNNHGKESSTPDFKGDSKNKLKQPLAYMSPETLIGRKQKFNKEVDMWSVGCIAYVLLSGTLPFGNHFCYNRDNRKAMLAYMKEKCGNGTNISHKLFQDDRWFFVSANAKRLITNLLTMDASKRWNATKALQCDWFQNKGGTTDRKLRQTNSRSVIIKIRSIAMNIFNFNPYPTSSNSKKLQKQQVSARSKKIKEKKLSPSITKSRETTRNC